LVEDHATAEEKQNVIPGTEATIHTVDIDNEGDERRERRERDVKAELLQILVKEHAHLRTNLSMGLAGLHEMSCLVAQEEARQIWLKEAIVVEREAVAAIAVLEGLNLRIHERCHYLDGNMDRGTSFLLHAQTIAKCTARADILDQVHALLPDVPAGRLELPDLHSMFMLLRAWEMLRHCQQ